MDKKNLKKRRGRKGLSTIVATLILIALTMVSITIIWVVVKNLIERNLQQAGSCMDIFDKVSINKAYTCYDSNSKELRFSLNTGNIRLSGVSVAISNVEGTKSIKLEDKTPLINYTYAKNYGDAAYGGGLKFPGENSGQTYVINCIINTTNVNFGFTKKPDSLKIYPIVSGIQCEAVDSLSVIGNC
ncbi:MAG: hypothetical protein KKA64_00185 [Nanoarchaeota archaeon]|nr:hypothetical protein [Nanoarchaeota archaeon]